MITMQFVVHQVHIITKSAISTCLDTESQCLKVGRNNQKRKMLDKKVKVLVAQSCPTPGGSDNKESTCNARDPGSVSGVRKIPRRRQWQPTPVSLPIHEIAKSWI